ncbi:MAG: signal peptidase I [Clostridia bacterium]|nr:signal peptidase I [Clostridia bacterium]
MNQNNKQEKEPFLHSTYDFAEMLVLAVIIVFLLFMSVARPCRVDGTSMNNTLEHGEMLLISKLFYTPTQGDIVVFHQTSEIDIRFNEPIVKRVIAVGGQHIKINTDLGKVYVSDDELFTEDEVLNEDYIYLDVGYWEDHYGIDEQVVSVPEGSVFVMGDNRNNSADSRYFVIGPVDCRRILGKVILRLTPFSKFGTVE